MQNITFPQVTVKQIKDNANARKRNAAATLSYVLGAFGNFLEDGDWTCLAWIVSLAGSSADQNRLKAIIEASSGITFRADVKQPTGLRVVKPSTEHERDLLHVLAHHVENGESFRGKALEEPVMDGENEMLPALLVKKAAKQQTLEHEMLTALRRIRKNHPDAATDARLTVAFSQALKAMKND